MGRKITIACLVLLCAVNNITAQTNGGPDMFGYVWRDSNDPNGPVYTWVDIVNAPNAVNVPGFEDDNIKGPFAIGFDFHYYWYDVSTFRIGSNGYIGFTSASVAHPFPIIPLPSAIQNYIAVMTSDLTFTDNNSQPVPGAECWYWTSPGADSLVVSYINVPFWDPVAPGHYTGSNTFQVVLSNVDSSITINIQNQTGVYNNPTNFATIGIENNSGNIGLMHSHDVLPPSVYSIKFYYPPTVTFQVNDASTVYNNNENTGALFLSKDGAPFIMNTQVTNSGNQPLASFNVFSRVVNNLNVVQTSGTLPSSALQPGDSEDLVFSSSPFLPVTAGTFRYISDTQLSGDATPSNNQKVLELQVVDTTQASILLTYDSGLDAGLGGLGWQGGGGGAAVEMKPPFYPCNITQLRAYITGNTNFTGFALMVLDDDGPGGTPLTVLDSVYVDAANVLTGTWNYATLTAPVTVDSGSFYVAWMMGGDGISIGQNQVPPISNRTYEILGQASNPNSWANYRSREVEDLMINAYISSLTIGLDEKENVFMGNFYPNPASSFVSIDYKLHENDAINWIVFDIAGKEILSGKHAAGNVNGTLNIDISTLPAGVYGCSLAGNETIVKRSFAVLK